MAELKEPEDEVRDMRRMMEAQRLNRLAALETSADTIREQRRERMKEFSSGVTGCSMLVAGDEFKKRQDEVFKKMEAAKKLKAAKKKEKKKKDKKEKKASKKKEKGKKKAKSKKSKGKKRKREEPSSSGSSENSSGSSASSIDEPTAAGQPSFFGPSHVVSGRKWCFAHNS
eukprot:CAMPEP_0117513236 /NCGR_PEP_ID=MMETSP0784-20121206/29448_1 /TAXON_ID=39447 /ORGANISM="" /LENGTH=170 /DNA_ID=CAMNT_0005308991 /DNA_START=22 /DNA_END=532 /DNA_ORIENTATION=+